jgi:lauroyl/myristoyl acyltransferase
MLENFPLFVGYGMTRGVTEIAYRLSPDQRMALEGNIRRVLGHTCPGLSPRELDLRARRQAHLTFWNRGVWFADLSILAGRRQMEGLFQFQVEGNWGALERARARGSGAILASAHLGNWFGGGVAVSRHGIPVRTLMYRNHAGGVMDQLVARRGNVRQTFVDDDPFSILEVIRALSRGEVVAVLADKPWDSQSLLVPFFGAPARFPLGPIRIARLARVPLFPAFCLWKRPRQFKAVLCDPIEVEAGDPERTEREALMRLARRIEEFVAPNLHIWFNFTPVWENL